MRLIVLSIVVGVVLSALGITPENIFYQLNILLQRIYDLGFGAIESVLGYLILGAMVVVPMWFISRLIKASRRIGCAAAAARWHLGLSLERLCRPIGRAATDEVGDRPCPGSADRGGELVLDALDQAGPS